MLMIQFEHHHDDHPELWEGPYEWIEMISGNMFALVPGQNEAEEIAGFNDDCSWDAGPFEDAGGGICKHRHYNRWTISELPLSIEGLVLAATRKRMNSQTLASRAKLDPDRLNNGGVQEVIELLANEGDDLIWIASLIAAAE